MSIALAKRYLAAVEAGATGDALAAFHAPETLGSISCFEPW
jgi:hypothetical protein